MADFDSEEIKRLYSSFKPSKNEDVDESVASLFHEKGRQHINALIGEYVVSEPFIERSKKYAREEFNKILVNLFLKPIIFAITVVSTVVIGYFIKYAWETMQHLHG